MKTYNVELTGHLKVIAQVTTDSLERAAEIAWNGELALGEKVEFLQEMECLDDGPTVEAVWDVDTGEGKAFTD
jgi:hypothetical protein